jgi:Flp pilus assembly protein TadG
MMILLLKRNQEGAVAILTGLVLLALVGFAALGIDIANLLVARNELQNAADAGALAGAQVLYNDAGTQVNTNANQTAYDTASSNKSQGSAIEINAGDIQRGHWSFASETFTHNDATAPVTLWNVSDAELDANVNFINAVKVTARRQATPVASFFARIFGYENFQLEAEAVAYIGFAGTLDQFDVNDPIAICAEAITGQDGKYTCAYGRMINSGQDDVTGETGGWTSFEQVNACTGGTNANVVKGLVCGAGNPEPIDLSLPIATNGGDIQSAFDKLFKCWTDTTGQKEFWTLTLPVIDCPGNNVGTCEKLSGAVTINIVWITGAGEDPQFKDIPVSMEGWSQTGCELGTKEGRQACWNSFVEHFNLRTLAGDPAPYMKKCIYFLPDCTPHDPAGGTGGKNYGILAKIPVLVS